MIPNPFDEQNDSVTPSPGDLAKMAEEPASQLYVLERCKSCPTTKSLRRWALFACVLLGAGLALQIFGLAALDARVERTVRKTLTDMSHERMAATLSQE